jgi:hypothetical protein
MVDKISPLDLVGGNGSWATSVKKNAKQDIGLNAPAESTTCLPHVQYRGGWNENKILDRSNCCIGENQEVWLSHSLDIQRTLSNLINVGH